MGSGAVMSTGIRNPDRFAATVAVSPTGAAVTPQVPRNPQAGSWEAGFVTMQSDWWQRVAKMRTY